MKKQLAILLLSLTLAGCEVEIDVDIPLMGMSQVTRNEHPTVNLPVSLRQQNWIGWKGEGSCVHAAMINLFRWQGKFAFANYWGRKYSNGETPDAIVGDPRNNLADKLTREGVEFAYTTSGDVDFLQRACDTRRGCGVTIMGGKHMVNLVHLDETYAGILDSNDPNTIHWVPREQFIAEWQNSNGWAVTPIYTPAPPLSI